MSAFVAGASFDLDAVEALGERCEASLEAAARRFVSLWPEPSLLIRLELTTKPSDRHGTPKLRVSSTLANGTWPYIPAYKSVGDDHPLNTCLEGTSVDCIADLDELASRATGAVELHARPYPFLDSEGVHRERVLAVARRVR